MKVEIWSDIMCPFCYIGKRRFEQALNQFEYADEVKVEWRSFQLNPDMETAPNASINEYLAESKGWSLNEARQMNERVTKMAAEEGLEYHMDQAVVANSFDAHRLIQFAKSNDLGDEAEETLFQAYFTEGKNMDDTDTLVEIAEQIGLVTQETREVLKSDQYAKAVQHDIQTAQAMNIRGVPFFLFNRKFAVSGAQESETFLKALKQSWNDWVEKQEAEEEPATEKQAN
ncbi:DsbA family oxidoreductase [Aliifodinibius salicampi]|uniref:DsbA family oxidoreductase n=1 Tax=Fodinibius salicampi TaxID=1920655 RepID=A0ABT3PWD4_9BACT|nr:DsbA family oxidoreductase [Fodinibius salicampi]MCW9712161.1 DsbA family oxidoreductase [Fodinibius salicampi]